MYPTKQETKDARNEALREGFYWGILSTCTIEELEILTIEEFIVKLNEARGST